MNKNKVDQIIQEIKEAYMNGKVDLFSKVYVNFRDDDCYDISNYFSSLGMYVNWMFGEDHDTNGGYIYLNWQTCEFDNLKFS